MSHTERMGKQERLVETAVPESRVMERNRHDDVDGSQHAKIRAHPGAERLAEGPTGPIFELVDGLPEGALEISNGQGLVKTHRLPPASPAQVRRTVAQSFGGLKGHAARGAERSGRQQVEQKNGTAEPSIGELQ